MTVSNLLWGARVRLAALTAADLPTVAGWQQDADFMRLFDASPAFPKTEDQLEEWLQERHKSPNDFVFAIRPPGSEELLGYIELDGILWAHGVCGIAIAIGDPSNRGKGYGSGAAQLALRFAFHELNLHRVTYTTFDYNAPSIALAENLGFRREGVFREFLQRDGHRHDMLLFGLLRHEWEAQR